MRYFNTLFLEEADEFIASLKTKTAKKVFTTLTWQNRQMIHGFLKNYKKISGSLEPSTKDNRYGFWHFGIKQVKCKPWSLQLMDSLRRLVKFPKMKLIELYESKNNTSEVKQKINSYG